MKYPKKLQNGATVGLVCPSSSIAPERVEKCRKFMEDLGFKVKIADNLAANYGGFMAGTGEVRAKWINTMFADPEVDAILCIRGGDGSHRIMEHLDLETIKKNPKVFVGYSDITNLHLAFNQECGFVTFHGPMVSSNMVEHFDEETKASFFEAINADAGYEFKNPAADEICVMKGGKAEGVLTGGNLALLSACIGTPYDIDTKGKILFIEEVGETMSRLDRMAWHLHNAGKFRDCAGLILGQFTDCVNKDMEEYTYLECFQDILRDLPIPVIYNVQSGHEHPNMTLPLGAVCEIDATDSKRGKLIIGTPER